MGMVVTARSELFIAPPPLAVVVDLAAVLLKPPRSSVE
jgi:hypothetical protein